MTIGPIHWGSYDGTLLEKLMAVLLGNEHQVSRREPSSGDGGVDILVPADGGWHVRQIKGFTGRMSAGRRAQVADSFRIVSGDPRLRDPVVAWSLTVPIDPTSGEQDWFEELTADSPIPCTWEGEIFWHSMAAAHPHVIDYYLRDGRGRIEDAWRTLHDATAAQRDGTNLDPNDVGGHLIQLVRMLNRDDPHFRYEFATSAVPAPVERTDGALMRSTRPIEGGGFLTTRVFYRYEGAEVDAPVRGEFTVTVYDEESGIDLRDQFEDWQMFGGRLKLPEGAFAGRIEGAPPGFGGMFDSTGTVELLPASTDGGPERTRLVAHHPEDGEVAEVILIRRETTAGPGGGVRVRLSDEHKVMTAELLLRTCLECSGGHGGLAEIHHLGG